MKKLLVFFLITVSLVFLLAQASDDWMPDIILTNPDGSWLDTRVYSNFIDANNAAGTTTDRTLHVIREESVDNDITVGENVTLHFLGAGKIIQTAGTTTVNASIKSGDKVIFSNTGAGSFDFEDGIQLRTSWFDNFGDAVDITTDDVVTLVVSDVENVTSSDALGDDVALEFEGPGNYLNIDSGVILSNVEDVRAGRHLCFLGSGRVDFEEGAELRSSWFERFDEAIRYIDDSGVVLRMDKAETLAANTTVPSTIVLLWESRGKELTTAAILTINGPIEAGDFKIFVPSTGTLDYNGPSALNTLWTADGDGTDDSAAIQWLIDAMPNPGGVIEFQYTPNGYGLSSALVISEKFTGNSGAHPSNITLRGIGGKPRLITLGAISAIETYDITVVEPAKWTFGLIIENIELDGNNVGVDGARLHGLARSSRIKDLYIHEFTNAAVFASRWIETTMENVYAWGDFADTTTAKYGIYHVDGTTVKIIGGTFNAFQTGYHADGNITEADVTNNDGPDGLTLINTVFESCGQYGINIEAGNRLRFIDVHIEGTGDTYVPQAIGIKVSNEGGQTPRDVIFDGGSISIDSSDIDEAFYMGVTNRVYFNKVSNSQLSGGYISSTANFIKIENGAWTNDFRITNDLPLTGNVHDGGNGSVNLSDASGNFVVDGVTTRMALYNITDDSSCQITAVGANTITCAAGLCGGADQDWDNGDIAVVVRSGIVNCNTGVSARPLFIEYEAEQLTFARGPGDYFKFDGFGNIRIVKTNGNDDAISFTTYDNAYNNFIEADGDAFFNTVTLRSFMSLDPTHLTVAAGALTVTRSYHTVSCQGLVNDDLNTINGGVANGVPSQLLLRLFGDGGNLTVVDAADNIQLEGDFIMDSTRDSLLLMWNGTNWQEISRSNND